MNRRVSARQVDLTKDAAKAKVCKVMEQKKAAENDALLDDLVKKLKASPSEIPIAHKMQADGMFQPESVREKSEGEPDFSQEYYLVHKVPKAWFLNTCCSVISEKWANKELQRSMQHKDEEYHIKLLEAGCCINRSDPFGPKNRESWRNEYVERMERCGILQQLCVQDDGSINWGSSGIYRLLPALPVDVKDPCQHKYESIAFGSAFTASLSEFTGVIGGSWEIHMNWHVSKAFVMKPGSSRELKCRDWFDLCAGYSDVVAPMYKFVESSSQKGKKAKQESDENFSLKRKRTFKDYVKTDTSDSVSPDAKKVQPMLSDKEPLRAPTSLPKRLARKQTVKEAPVA
eukprot:3473792-Amphidinium_carterae.2